MQVKHGRPQASKHTRETRLRQAATRQRCARDDDEKWRHIAHVLALAANGEALCGSSFDDDEQE